jgi:inosine-uridine nucleoside N-ribohydrolase
MIGLNVTRGVLYNYVYDRRLKDMDTALSRRVSQILSAVGSEDKVDYAAQMAFADDPVRAMHDVLAMAYIIDPSIFQSELLPIKIGLRGQTVVETGGRPVNVITAVDKTKFFDMFISTIEGYKC